MQDDEDEGTDLEEYDDGDSDGYSDDDFGYDNLQRSPMVSFDMNYYKPY